MKSVSPSIGWSLHHWTTWDLDRVSQTSSSTEDRDGVCGSCGEDSSRIESSWNDNLVVLFKGTASVDALINPHLLVCRNFVLLPSFIRVLAGTISDLALN